MYMSILFKTIRSPILTKKAIETVRESAFKMEPLCNILLVLTIYEFNCFKLINNIKIKIKRKYFYELDFIKMFKFLI